MTRNSAFRLLLLAMTAILALPSCLVIEDSYQGLPPGTWRGVLRFEPSYITLNPKGKPLPEKVDMEYEEVTQGELPFLFTVNYPSPDSFFLTLQLGDKELILSDYVVGKDYSTAKDTITIRFPGTSNYFRGVFEEKVLEGNWIFFDEQGNENSLPLIARQGQDMLFSSLRKTPAADLNGTWYMRLGIEEDDAQEVARLQLFHSENDLKAILEWQGKRYEYLSGTVQARKLYLSWFDGVDAILMEGKIEDNGELLGAIRSGKVDKTLWLASKNQRNQ